MIVYTQMFKPLICSFCRAREVSPQSDFVTLSLKPSITWYFSYLQYIASLSAVPRLPRGNDALLYPVRTFCPSCDNMSVTYDSSTLGSTKTSISTFTYDSNTPMVAVMAAGSAFLGELITLRLFDAQDLMYLGPNAAADPVWDIETGWYGWKWTKITEILDWIKNSCFICRAPLLTLPAFSYALFWSCCVFSERFVAKKLSYWIEEIPFVGKFFGTWLQSRLFDTLITQLLCPSVEKNAVLVDGHRKSQGLQLWYFGPFGVMNNCFAWYNYTISWCEMSCAKYPPSITKLSWLLGADNLDVEVPSIQHHCCHFSHNLPWRPHIQGCQNRLQKGRVFSGKKILPASRGWRSTLVGVTGFHQELRLFDSWISLQESWAAGIGIFEIGPLGPWGYPCDGCPQNHWLNGWTLAVWNHVNIWQNFQKWTLLRHVILRDFKWKLKDKTLFFFKVRQPVLSQLFRLWYCSHDPKYLIL